MEAPVAQPAKALLVLRRITQRRAAQDLDCHPQHLCQVLNGQRPPSPRLVVALADYLDVSPAELFHHVAGSP